MGADRATGEIEDRIAHLLQAISDTPASNEQQAVALRSLQTRMHELRVDLNGDRTISSRAEPVPLSLSARVGIIARGRWNSQSSVTGNFRDSREVAAAQFPAVLAELQGIAADLRALEQQLESASAPWTPSRIPDWP